ncbi:MAG: dephospho-CoA kinase [Flavobacteriaceae bacterium]|nr:dephospho-CoA kinase [Bacteroidia bacterium]NNL60630.1 dephospho-CoA kinase [Flavobacteriaceae bacterium]
MKIVGLTGGIGSGKTTVAKMFMELGVPVFFADIEAKKLMNSSKVIRRKLIQLFGKKAYIDDELNRPFIASKIFNDEALLEKMNGIIHPKVAKRFQRWASKQTTPYVISEVAILFENDSYKNYDYIITVVAKEEDRIKRLLERDDTTEEKIRAIMKNQWPDEDKIRLSDYVIVNNELQITTEQVKSIHKKLLKRAKTS